MTKAPKKKGLTKCYVCTHSYKAEEVDEHMNGVTHHLVLEQLYNKSRPHHCLVCGCVWKGLTLYRQHVGTPGHKQKIAALAKQRRSGANVALKYTTPPDLINLCRERDRLNTENKAKRRLEKINARKARHQGKACNSKGTQSNSTHQHPHPHPYPHHQQNKENNNRSSQSPGGEPRGRSLSPDSPSSSSNREWDGPALHQEVSSSQADGAGSSRTGSVCSEPEPHSSHAARSKEQGGSFQSSGCGNRPSASQFFSEIDFSLDFTNDLLPPVGALLFAHPPAVKAGPSKGKGKVSNHTGALSTETADGKQNASPQAKRSRKRPLNPSEGPPGSSTEHNRQEDLPRAPGLVKAHVQHISTILRRIRKSLDEEGLANLQPPSASTTDDDGHNRVLKKLKTEHDGDGHNSEEGTGVEDEETTNSDSRETLQPAQSPKSSSSSAADPPSSSQSRLGLPELLKRDLSRLSAKSGAHHEPNLTAARRVRTLSSSQAGEAEKDVAAGPGLRPTLQKLINSTVAKRKVNWKELYQEYHKKKRLREKGMPRFGIELVSPVVPLPDDLHLEEVQDLPLGEDFQWDSIDFDTSGSPMCCEDPVPEEPYLEDHEPSAGHVDGDTGPHRPAGVFVKIEKDDWGQRDSQDVPSPAESSCHDKEDRPGSERAKPKKERQVDELLAVSLREEELSSSLLNLEDSLTQARGTLQEAYVKVQQLLMVREQTASDINALRAKRIEILRFMRGGSSADDGEKQKTKRSPERSPQPLSSSQPDALPGPSPDVPNEVAKCAPSTMGLDEATQLAVSMKEEPASPTSGQGLEVSPIAL
ncbi:uncharacterized protein znf106b [Alosa pseudoharengus]|uniref:uncharacterized protein znf106b n=1 Tax=Alosa pseudoharengus TaxID=34774 RepID=UPI003F88A8DD